MDAAAIAAMMRDDEQDSEGASAKPARPVPAHAPPPAAKRAPKKALPPGPAKAQPKPAAAAQPAQAEDIRALMMEEVHEPPKPAASPRRMGGNDMRALMMADADTEAAAPPRRFEPVASYSNNNNSSNVAAGGRGPSAVPGGGAPASGGGFLSVVVLGTEERAETFDSSTRKFVAYVIELQRDDGTGPYLIYRRYKQFHYLHGKCRSHGLHVTDLPPKRNNNWFGFGAIDAQVVADRIPKLQAWFAALLALPGTRDFKLLQDWLAPYQIGDLKPRQYAESVQ